ASVSPASPIKSRRFWRVRASAMRARQASISAWWPQRRMRWGRRASCSALAWLYGLQTSCLHQHRPLDQFPDERAHNHEIFVSATQWWWVCFLIVLVALALFRKLKIRRTWNELLQKAGAES